MYVDPISGYTCYVTFWKEFWIVELNTSSTVTTQLGYTEYAMGIGHISGRAKNELWAELIILWNDFDKNTADLLIRYDHSQL